MHDDARTLPTAGHLLTALDYTANAVQAHRNRVPTGAMIRYPWDLVPPGWTKCVGGSVDIEKHPALHRVTGGRLPHEPGWIIKL